MPMPFIILIRIRYFVRFPPVSARFHSFSAIICPISPYSTMKFPLLNLYIVKPKYHLRHGAQSSRQVPRVRVAYSLPSEPIYCPTCMSLSDTGLSTMSVGGPVSGFLDFPLASLRRMTYIQLRSSTIGRLCSVYRPGTYLPSVSSAPDHTTYILS